MSSGIIFKDKDYDCSNGMAEYLHDLCIHEFPTIEEYERYPHILDFFSIYRDSFFSGHFIFIYEDDFSSKGDFLFLAKLFSKVFDTCESDSSELTDSGKSKIREYFRDFVVALEKHASELS